MNLPIGNKNWHRPFICIVLCSGLGFLFGRSAMGEIQTWYAELIKPVFNPPNWIFGPVWSVLYVMMGIAAGLIWNLGLSTRGVKPALLVFLVQFVLNLAWTPIFFGNHMMFAGLIVISVLWLILLINIRLFSKLRKLSGLLLVPYLLWVSFATILNLSLWHLNS